MPLRCRAPLAALALAGLLAQLLGGCAASGPESRPAGLEFASAGYEDLFERTLAVLREQGYEPARIDRRFGVIETAPRPAGSLVEPWRWIGAAESDPVAATVQYQRRIVRAEFRPVEQEDAAAPPDRGGLPPVAASDPSSDAAADVSPWADPLLVWPFVPAEHPGRLRLELACMIEEARQPGRRIETTSLSDTSTTRDPALAARGIPPRFWTAVRRDHVVEEDLLALIAP